MGFSMKNSSSYVVGILYAFYQSYYFTSFLRNLQPLFLISTKTQKHFPQTLAKMANFSGKC